jgi:hypothetical protein
MNDDFEEIDYSDDASYDEDNAIMMEQYGAITRNDEFQSARYDAFKRAVEDANGANGDSDSEPPPVAPMPRVEVCCYNDFFSLYNGRCCFFLFYQHALCLRKFRLCVQRTLFFCLCRCCLPTNNRHSSINNFSQYFHYNCISFSFYLVIVRFSIGLSLPICFHRHAFRKRNNAITACLRHKTLVVILFYLNRY